MPKSNGDQRRPNGHIRRHRNIAAQLWRDAKDLHTHAAESQARLARAQRAIAESRATLETMRAQHQPAEPERHDGDAA